MQSNTIGNYVLCAEAKPIDQEWIREILLHNEPSLQVMVFGNGLELIQYLASPGKDKYYPCCVIVNIAMPVWDGIKTLAALKKEPAWKDIPVVMLAAPGQEKDAALALKMGADQVISKPVPAGALKQAFEISCRKEQAVKLTSHPQIHI